LCLSCRGRRARRERCRFEAARRATLVDARARGLLRANRPGGRYGERFITLTVPHLPTDTVRSRIGRVFCAWTTFIKLLNLWARTIGVHVEFVRVSEWTQGDDGLGHPHIHAWIFSPYIRQHDLTEWWADALERTGVPSGYPILKVHVEEVRGAKAANELIKYLCKDIGAGGRYIAPETYAEVYAALDGRRALQSSRGFRARCAAHTACPHCRATRSRCARVMRKTRLPSGAGPVASGDAPPPEALGPESGSARIPARPGEGR
jgi:hypothetical protein